MRIGVNCLNIDPEYAGGVMTYTLGLMDGWVRTAPDDVQFVIIVNAANKALFEPYAKQRPQTFSIELIENFDSRFKQRLLWQAVKLQSKGLYEWLHKVLYQGLSAKIDGLVDVVYSPNTVLFPIHQNKPTVLSMHDIQQVHFPEFFEPMQLKDRYITYNLSAEHLDKLQATSEHMKDDFLQYFPTLKPEQVVKIPEGVDIELFQKPRETDYLEAKYNLPSGFLYYPAQLWLHKNHITVLRALKKLRDEDNIVIPLVLTGSRYSASESIFQFIEENKLDQVHYLGKIPFEDVIALFQKAKFLITAVLYESSSLPVLEAAAAGTPVIASSTRPNQELGEVLQINLFEPKDVNELVALLKSVWQNQTLIDAQVLHNRENISYYSWDNAARRYIQLFRELANK